MWSVFVLVCFFKFTCAHGEHWVAPSLDRHKLGANFQLAKLFWHCRMRDDPGSHVTA